MFTTAELDSSGTTRGFATSATGERQTWNQIEAQYASGVRGYWYALAPSDEVPADRALAVKRMGEDLAIWRDGAGVIRVMVDRCPHRGAKLSRGRVMEGSLRCWYHGWLYNGDGECVDVPSEGSACSFLKDISVRSYPAAEHGGLIFAYFPVTDEAPTEPCPNPYELESPEWNGFIVRHHWKGVSWFRAMENLVDPFHAPFLHAGTYTLSRTKSFQDTIEVVKQPDGSVHIGRKGQALVNFDSTEYHFPNWFRLDIPYPWSAGPGGPMRILVLVCPIDETSSQVYMVRKRKITGWRWWIWNVLWHARLERKMWQVIDQDEDILLSQCNGEALKSEYLVQSDLGIVRMRNMFRDVLRKRQQAVDMSVYAAEKFVFKLKKDAELQAAFREDPDGALSSFDLTDEERRALGAGDLPNLYKMGLHPLLLAPYARFMKIKREDYQAQLDPLRGLVKMRS